MGFSRVIALKALHLPQSSITSSVTRHTTKLITLTASNPKRLLSTRSISNFNIFTGDYQGVQVEEELFQNIRCDYPFSIQGSKDSMHFEADDEAWYGRIDLPGVNRQGLRVWVEGNAINVEAQEASSEDDKHYFKKESTRVFKSEFNFEAMDRNYRVKELKVVLSHGVLKFMLPIAKPAFY